ncbi:cell division protein FtsK [Paenibacillus swuensis]|uniref:Cell division protein FtsK n=1 Tax=Paenibacillus swuensis TaxID=1178515 RepID=A0A172TPN1_9BACL|nr:DNA translocase FtsK [Paenibacillus swuensis]ANE48970.1 cell division protein FtsK [Paenibacillus swuensis]
MAKKKKKKSNITSTLKFEVYGILIITLSVISLSGEATVGRALMKLFRLVLGGSYFVLPLIFIYIGLFVMWNRSWPKGWSLRRTGLFVILLAFTIHTHVAMIDLKFNPAGVLTAGSILETTQRELFNGLVSVPAGTGASPVGKDYGGGYTGGLGYALLFFLFGYTGTKLMIYTMFIIGFMLITGVSYVELAQAARNKGKNAVGRMDKKIIHVLKQWQANRSLNVASRNTDRSENMPSIHEDDEFDEENYTPLKPKKRPLFFQLLQKEPKTGQADDAEDDDDGDELIRRPLPGNISAKSKRAVSSRTFEDDDLEEESETHIPVPAVTLQTAEAQPFVPIIRNFEDQLPIAELDDEETAFISNASSAVTLQAHVNSSDNGQSDGDEISDEMNGMFVPEPPVKKPYKLPPFHLLAKGSAFGKGTDQMDYMSTARKLEATLESFGVRAKVLEVVKGPTVTRYEIQPDTGVKVSRIVSLTDDIALALAAKDIRMEAPIPGKAAIGIEVPNSEVSIVTMREVMESAAFQDASSKMSITLGRDISGQPIVGNLARMPHLLVAGATGSGKSVCINGIITSILYKAKPDEVKFLMVDPKMVELNVYNGIPHLLAPVVTDPRRASLALKKIVLEMEKRYELFSKSGTRNIEGYNTMLSNKGNIDLLPYIVVIVDELADLMMVAASDVEDAICRLAQMARAAGIHLIIATQRPSVDVITGVIKANIPSRIAFGVSSNVDSRTILDMAGAEKLLGRGDMLYLPMGASKPIRVQGAFLSDPEVEAVVNFCRDQEQAEYKEDLVPEVEDVPENGDQPLDELFDQAVQIILEAKQASVSLLQRRMRIGYTRAARLIDSMEAKGVVGPYEGSKPREVLISLEQYQHNRIS